MKKHLHSGVKWKFRFEIYSIPFVMVIGGLLSFATVGVGYQKILSSVTPSFYITILAIFIFFVIVAEIYARMTYNRWFYEFTDKLLKIEHGIIWKRYAYIPYGKVQNIDVRRGILGRVFGYSTVNIETAGGSRPNKFDGAYGIKNKYQLSEGYIPAIEMKEAEKIKSWIMKKISRRRDGGVSRDG